MIIKPENRRKFNRIHFDRQLNLKFMSDIYDNYHANSLSLTGMFVTGDLQKHIGNYCLLNLAKTETSTDLCFQARGKVVRKDDEGVAVKFTLMPRNSYMFLQLTLLNGIEYPFVVEKLLPNDCPFEVTDMWFES